MQSIIHALALYAISLSVILTYTKILFFISHFRKNNSVNDIAYGPAFIFATVILTMYQLSKTPISLYSLIMFFLIIIWGTRLSYRIYRRNHGREEDFRHKMQREKWMEKGKTYATFRTYIQLFVFQGIIISIILLPFTLSLSASPKNNTLLLLGLVMWIIGFYFEEVGDSELDKFVKTRHEHGQRILKSGLWKYTRHPNYFGESLMWLSLAVIAIGATESFIPLLSPILITYLILFVTGVPHIEKRFEGHPEWEEYKKRTNKFIPSRPKIKF